MDIYYYYLIIGVALIITEVVLFQVAFLWLLIAGLAFLVAGAVTYFLSLQFVAANAVLLAAYISFSAIFIQKIRENRKKKKQVGGEMDVIGMECSITKNIGAKKPGEVDFSGTSWLAKLEDGSTGELTVGNRVQIVAVKGITLIVKPV